MWYHERAIANILSLNNVRKRFRVIFDSEAGNQFIVSRGDGSKRVFKPTGQGLYTSRIKDITVEGVSLVSTVEGNKTAFTKRQVG